MIVYQFYVWKKNWKSSDLCCRDYCSQTEETSVEQPGGTQLGVVLGDLENFSRSKLFHQKY